MGLTKFNGNVSNHQNQPDKPALTAAQLKKLFDKAPEDIKDFINNTLISELDTKFNNTIFKNDVINNFEGGTNKAASAELAKTLKNGKQDKISFGTSIPESLEEGEIYIQFF